MSKPVLTILLLAIAALAIFFMGARGNLFAAGEAMPACTEGLSVIPLQTGPQTYGFAMVDPKNETICIYEINARAPAFNRLKLIAARSFRYDRLLENYNSGEPRPEQVRDILKQATRNVPPGEVERPLQRPVRQPVLPPKIDANMVLPEQNAPPANEPNKQ